MRRWLAEAFRDFNAAVGLTAAHDYDLLDEPSAPATASPWPPQLADTSTQRPSGGTAGLRSVDGPTALGGTAGAVGHPQTSVVSELRAHNSADRPAPSSTTIASGHGTPQSAGAGHPSQYPLTDVEAAGAEWLNTLRTLLARLGDTCADVVEHIERLDPTPTGLARAAAVTDLDTHRR
ncbi:hypothetical protein BST10_10235 [Mycolicibacter algericus DSM 45454]|nr:hypothetical protein BST10_10235 [Mycolicibacter algericus DSM 45454]